MHMPHVVCCVHCDGIWHVEINRVTRHVTYAHVQLYNYTGIFWLTRLLPVRGQSAVN